MTKKKKWILIAVACGIFIFVGVAFVVHLARQPEEYAVAEERLFDLGTAYNIKCKEQYETPDYFLSEDGSHIVMVLKTADGKLAVLWDDRVGPAYREILDLQLSPDGQRYAYITRDADKKLSCVVDGREGKKYDYIIDSANEPRFQYSAVMFSSDSKHVAYIAKDGEKTFVVFDETELEKHDRVINPYFSQDGKNFIYQASNGKEYFFVRNGKRFSDVGRSEPHRPIYPIYTPNAEPIICEIVDQKPHTLVVGDGGKREYPYSKHLAITPDGKQFAYQEEVGEKFAAIWNGEKGESFDRIPKLQFSPDGQHLAYVGWNASKCRVVFDNRDVGSAYDIIVPVFGRNRYGKTTSLSTQLCFSPDSKHFVYVGGDNGGKSVVVRDGKEDSKYTYAPWVDSGDSDNANSIKLFIAPVFSPDSQHLAYVATARHLTYRSGGGQIILDGKELGKYDNAAWPTFSPDSKHLAYVATNYGNKTETVLNKISTKFGKTKYQFVVIDEKPGPLYSWVSAPAFRADGTLVYYAIRDNMLYRVTKKP